MAGLKTAIITGGNTGIGFNAAGKLLAKGGYELILACRNLERGNAAAEALRAAHPGSSVTVMQCDVGSLQSVEQFADAVKATKTAVHLLILNAGLFAGMDAKPQLTVDGFELTFGTNHVATSSKLHERGHFAPPNWQLLDNDAKGYSGFQAYSNSKLANVMFAYELNRIEGPNGITATALHPGAIFQSEFNRSLPSFVVAFLRYAVAPIGRLVGFAQTLEDGGDATMAAALSENGGLYFDVTKETPSSDESRNEKLQTELWMYTAQIIKDARANRG